MMARAFTNGGVRFAEQVSASYKSRNWRTAAMPSDERLWEDLAKNTLRAAMMQRGVSYAVLADRLEAIGVHDNEVNLRNKVARGRFTAVFLMQCLKALDAEWIHIPASLDEATGKSGAQKLAREGFKGPRSGEDRR